MTSFRSLALVSLVGLVVVGCSKEVVAAAHRAHARRTHRDRRYRDRLQRV